MGSRADLTDLDADRAIPLLLDRYGSKLYRLGLRVCGNEDEAQDLLQETFLNAWRKWDQFEGRSTPSSWLYTIAVRACRRRHRRRSGEPATIRSLDDLLPAGEQIAVVPDEEDPLSAAAAQEAEARLSAALVTLPLRYRLPLILKDIAELPVQQVGEILGLKEATVKTRVHRARLQLRESIDRLLPNQPAPPPDHPRSVCLDLLRGKQEALDRGVPFAVSDADLCQRCRALFRTLDLTQETCRRLGTGELPPPVRRFLTERMDSAVE